MKRKVPERIPKPQLQIRSPSQRRQGLRRSSDSLFPPNPTDTSCRKGVKSLNLDDENRRPPRIESDNAKTSEYAFFKKLKEDVSNNHQSCCSKSNQACRGSSSKPRDSSGERTSSIQNKCDNIRSAGVNKDAIPEGFESSHALNGSALRETGKGLDLFEEVESQTRHTNVFERKRRKLLQWVRETSFPEIDDYCMDGSNLVSVLLNRLIPKSCENNSVKNPKLMEVLPSEKSMPLPSLESDIHFKELQLPPAESLMDLGSDPFSGDSTLSCLSKRSRGIVSCSYSPTSSTYKNYLDYTVWEPDSALLLGGSAVSCPNIDSNSILPLEEFGLATSGCVKELDILYPPHKYMHGREPYAPMLGWDFDRMDEGKLSNLSRHRADLELLGSCTMSCPMIDSVNVFPFSDNGLREPSHVKELDIFCQPSEYLVEKPQCAPMLGWNFDSTNEESNAHSLSRYRAGCELLRNSAVSGSMGGADSVVPFKEYGLRASGHVEELDIFCRPNKYLDGKEPCTLMLDWDFDYAIEERNSSNLFRHSAEYTPACLTSYNKSDVERLCLEGRYDLQSDFSKLSSPQPYPAYQTI
ncbi:uncharacterized protein LOC126784088 [Argentina anserina]|uniref:uncharacterized protein LOC126784088 n=1 Tax=Argentina anserina TaxID=57926 RepID=UPI0021764A8E|nr:uncharacterized protein LOC126784088 [Potentilla anserina]